MQLIKLKPGMVSHAFNSSTPEFEVSLVYTESQSSQGHIVRPYLKQHQQNPKPKNLKTTHI